MTTLVLTLLSAALEAAPDLVEIVTGEERETLAERIERARSFAKDPIDPSEEDAARRQRMLQAVRGEG